MDIKLREAIVAYIDAIRRHGATAQANAKSDLLMEVSNLQNNVDDRQRLLDFVTLQLKMEFSKDD